MGLVEGRGATLCETTREGLVLGGDSGVVNRHYIPFALSASKGDRGDRSSFDLAQDERKSDPCGGLR
jgi:hypothetical protein